VKSRFKAPPTTSFPNVYASPGKLWKPANYDDSDHGVLTVEEATWNSINTVYAGIVDTITPQQLSSMATRLGVRSKLEPNYSLVLGTADVSVLDMASAYSTFADRGSHIEPYSIRRIEDADGDVLFDASGDVERQQVISQGVADTVTTVLQGVLSKGTGTSAAIRTVAAGKTGTTNDSKDAWFTGYTCNLTASVWMGYEVPKEMKSYKGRSVAGGTFPAAIWRDFMNKATQGDPSCHYPATDAGRKILNAGLSPSSSTATSVPKSSSTTSSVPRSTTSSVPGRSTTVPGSSTTTTVPRSTTTVPHPTTTAPARAPG
jgi:penicillin-binding protein 1A